MADYNYTIADEDDDIFKVTMGESTRRTVEQEEDDDEPLLSGGSLKKDDLLEYENLNKIRTYMIQRKVLTTKTRKLMKL